MSIRRGMAVAAMVSLAGAGASADPCAQTATGKGQSGDMRIAAARSDPGESRPVASIAGRNDPAHADGNPVIWASDQARTCE